MRVNIVEVTHRNRTVSVVRGLAELGDDDFEIVGSQIAGWRTHRPGQSLLVQVPHLPGQWLEMESALAANPEGQLEFHLPTQDAANALREVARVTHPGDTWQLQPKVADSLTQQPSELALDPTSETLMVADGIGWAAMKSLITGTFGGPTPRSLHLFIGAASPGGLYDLQYVWNLAASSPWLHVHPVVRELTDPWWLNAGPDSRPPSGLGIPQVGDLGEVVSRFGSWRHARILVSGSAEQVQRVRSHMEAKGTPAGLIQSRIIAAA